MQILDSELPAAKKIHPSSTTAQPSAQQKHAPLTPPREDPASKKRKRDDVDEADPKLQEFLKVMDPKRASKKQREDLVAGEVEMAPPPVEDESDGEYEDIPSKEPTVLTKEAPVAINDENLPLPSQPETLADVSDPELDKAAPSLAPVGATDDDWLRSRTNRLLDLVDPDDPNFASRSARAVDESPQIPVTTGPRTEEGPRIQDTTVDLPERPAEPGDGDTAETLIQKTARLFVRNLPYTATDDSLRTRFEKFGAVEEVRRQRRSSVLFLPCVQLACTSST